MRARFLRIRTWHTPCNSMLEDGKFLPPSSRFIGPFAQSLTDTFDESPKLVLLPHILFVCIDAYFPFIVRLWASTGNVPSGFRWFNSLSPPFVFSATCRLYLFHRPYGRQNGCKPTRCCAECARIKEEIEITARDCGSTWGIGSVRV